MGREQTKPHLSARRRRGACVQVIGGGILILLMPMLLWKTPAASGFSALAPAAWLMVVGGIFLLWTTKDDAVRAPAKPQIKPGRPRAPLVAIARNPATPGSAKPNPTAPRRLGAAAFMDWRNTLVELIGDHGLEAIMETLFQQAGMDTALASHESGYADLWFYPQTQTGDAISLMQCRHCYGGRVMPEQLYDLFSLRALDDQPPAAAFAPEVITFARDSGIFLLDRQGFFALLEGSSLEQQRELLEVAMATRNLLRHRA